MTERRAYIDGSGERFGPHERTPACDLHMCVSGAKSYPRVPNVPDFPRVLTRVLHNLSEMRRGNDPSYIGEDEERVGLWLQQCEQVRLQEES